MTTMSNSPAGVGFRTIDDLDVSGKTVLVRAALNVPVQGGKVTDITRRRSLEMRPSVTLRSPERPGERRVRRRCTGDSNRPPTAPSPVG